MEFLSGSEIYGLDLPGVNLLNILDGSNHLHTTIFILKNINALKLVKLEFSQIDIFKKLFFLICTPQF